MIARATETARLLVSQVKFRFLHLKPVPNKSDVMGPLVRQGGQLDDVPKREFPWLPGLINDLVDQSVGIGAFTTSSAIRESLVDGEEPIAD